MREYQETDSTKTFYTTALWSFKPQLKTPKAKAKLWILCGILIQIDVELRLKGIKNTFPLIPPHQGKGYIYILPQSSSGEVSYPIIRITALWSFEIKLKTPKTKVKLWIVVYLSYSR